MKLENRYHDNFYVSFSYEGKGPKDQKITEHTDVNWSQVFNLLEYVIIVSNIIKASLIFISSGSGSCSGSGSISGFHVFHTPHQAGGYPGFCGMMWLGVFLLTPR